MARYIDADMVEQFLYRNEWGTPDEHWRPESEFGAFIDAVPTADVVEVVRCEDCEFWQTDWIPNTGGDRGCHYCEMMDSFTEPLHYCGCGERREE